MVKNKEIRKANEEYGILTGEEYERRLAYLIDKREKDYNTQMIGARNEGRQEGIEKITKRLLKLGVSVKIIEKAIKDEKEIK